MERKLLTVVIRLGREGQKLHSMFSGIDLGAAKLHESHSPFPPCNQR